MSAIAQQAPILDRPFRPGETADTHDTPDTADDRRAHLRLVLSGDAAVGGVGLRSPLRLTRAGRLVVSVLVASTLALLGVGLVGQLASAGPAPRPVTVVAGDTLSQLAARELPSLPISDGVIEIQLANHLSTDNLNAGQTLLIPAP